MVGGFYARCFHKKIPGLGVTGIGELAAQRLSAIIQAFAYFFYGIRSIGDLIFQFDGCGKLILLVSHQSQDLCQRCISLAPWQVSLAVFFRLSVFHMHAYHVLVLVPK